MTTLYLRGNGSSEGFLETPYHYSVLVDARPNDYTTTALVDNASGLNNALGAMSLSAGSSSSYATTSTRSGVLTDPGYTAFGFYSPPLLQSVTISGTVAVDVWAHESSMSANAAVSAVLWKVSATGTVTLIGSGSNGTELGTSATQMTINITPTSTLCDVGDVFMLGIYIDNATSTSMGSGYFVFITLNGPEGSSGDSQIRFTETLTFASSYGSSPLYLFLPTNSDVSGSGKKKLWTSDASTQTIYSTSVASAPARNLLTDSPSGQTLEWYTPTLEAVTLSGIVDAGFYMYASGNNSSAILCKIYKTDSDGSNPVLIGHGRSLTNASNSVPNWAPCICSINGSLSQGQRILVRLYTASGYSDNGTGMFSINSTSTLNFYAKATNASYIRFPATLTEYNPSPQSSVGDYWGSAA